MARQFSEWIRSNALSNILAAGAVLIAAGAYVQTHEQQQSIKDLKDASASAEILKVQGEPALGPGEAISTDNGCLLIQGFRYNLPSVGDMWLALRRDDGGKYYLTKISPGGTSKKDAQLASVAKKGADAWHAALQVADEKHKDSVSYNLTLLEADSGASAQLSQNKLLYQGLDSLPHSLLQLSTVKLSTLDGTYVKPNGEKCTSDAASSLLS